MIPPPTFWSDMDGVVVKYERHAYRHIEADGYTRFTRPGEHYFLCLDEDPVIIQAYRLLSEKGTPVHVISNIDYKSPLLTEQADDKREWIRQHMPFVKNFTPICVPKAEHAVKMLGRRLTPTDVLVSDYNQDLKPWRAAGGTGVKYLNGINSRGSIDCIHIEHCMPPAEIAAVLTRLLYPRNT